MLQHRLAKIFPEFAVERVRHVSEFAIQILSGGHRHECAVIVPCEYLHVMNHEGIVEGDRYESLDLIVFLVDQLDAYVCDFQIASPFI